MKVAVITGASQGIGAGLAAAFRRAGYAVVGTSRTIGPSDEPDFLTDDYAAVTAMNLARFFHVTQRAIRQMLIQGAGHVVNITTSLADHANSGSPAALTALTKGGLAAVTRSLAIEYASRGIRVNAVALGVVKTPEHDPASCDGMAGLHPIGRIGEIGDVADAIVSLDRAGFVTGEILHIDMRLSSQAPEHQRWRNRVDPQRGPARLRRREPAVARAASAA
jgi:NAD(P)-dependent dehydrogenase (short-subunit alcohol dehydrogenase family)